MTTIALFGAAGKMGTHGARMAVVRARETIFQPNWKDVFKPENVPREGKASTQGIGVK
jgi:hypothetical protein